MLTSASAGVEFLGSGMRYVEIEHSDDGYRLLRLGDCDFEFDVHEVLFGNGPEAYLDTIAEAITEVFDGSMAEVFRVAVHPPASRSFMSSVFGPAGVTSESARKEQLVFEAALLDVDRDVVAVRAASGIAVSDVQEGGLPSTVGVDIAVSAQEPVSRRNHVSHISSTTHERLEDVFARAGRKNLETISSSEAVARVLREVSLVQNENAKSVMSVGVFENYSMYTLMRDGEWLFSHQRAETEPEDVLYFALQMLRLAQEQLSDVGLVALFGPGNTEHLAGVIGKLIEQPTENMNPLSVVDLKGNSFQKDFAHFAFTMCIGAAL